MVSTSTKGEANSISIEIPRSQIQTSYLREHNDETALLNKCTVDMCCCYILPFSWKDDTVCFALVLCPPSSPSPKFNSFSDLFNKEDDWKKKWKKTATGKCTKQRWWATKIQMSSQNRYHAEKDRQNSLEKSINCFPGAGIWLSRESKACFSEFTIELLFLIGGVSRDLFWPVECSGGHMVPGCAGRGLAASVFTQARATPQLGTVHCAEGSCKL